MFATEFLIACQNANTILLTGPQSLDGDSIGACLALKEMLTEQCTAVIDVAGIPTHQYVHLRSIDQWKPDEDLQTTYDVAIVVDGDRFRLAPNVESAFNASTISVLIDHHKSTDVRSYTLSWLNGTAVSTCSMIYALARSWDSTITSSIAEALYIGILFDTGGFQHSNTNSETLRIAATLMEFDFDANRTYIKVVREKRLRGWKLQSALFQNSTLLFDQTMHIGWVSMETMASLECDSGDIEGLVNDLRCTTGVDFAALIVGLPNGTHKVSLRSNPTFKGHDGIDCSTLAKTLSNRGGGHTRAAGARLDLSLEASIAHVKQISLQFALKATEQSH